MAKQTSPRIQVKRIYQEPGADDGQRILVDRLWPRGVSKERADLDLWCKEIAPSNELRKWYGHVPERFDEFAERYRAELEQPERAALVSELRERATQSAVTLLTATKQPEISEAAGLQEVLATSKG